MIRYAFKLLVSHLALWMAGIFTGLAVYGVLTGNNPTMIAIQAGAAVVDFGLAMFIYRDID